MGEVDEVITVGEVGKVEEGIDPGAVGKEASTAFGAPCGVSPEPFALGDDDEPGRGCRLHPVKPAGGLCGEEKAFRNIGGEKAGLEGSGTVFVEEGLDLLNFSVRGGHADDLGGAGAGPFLEVPEKAPAGLGLLLEALQADGGLEGLAAIGFERLEGKGLG